MPINQAVHTLDLKLLGDVAGVQARITTVRRAIEPKDTIIASFVNLKMLRSYAGAPSQDMENTSSPTVTEVSGQREREKLI